MGYRCPVCDDPQADSLHLANHLGFTAIARGGDHEAWLDEQVSGWGEMDEHELADRVSKLAEPAEYPTVFEDTTGHEDSHANHEGDHDHAHQTPGMTEIPFDVGMDEETRRVVERARELTQARRSNSGGDDIAGGEDSTTATDEDKQ